MDGSFFQAVFGSHYKFHVQYTYSLQLYCLFVITLTISLCIYTVHQYRVLTDKTFEERVHGLRAKYSTARRPSDE